MKLSKVLASAAALGLAVPVMADTLELRVVGDGDAASVAGGGVVNVYIQGRIQGATDDGLALWGANLSDAGAGSFDVTGAVLDSPGGDIDQFKKNLGLTNPAGYGGTAIGGNLIQIGGGQNTIGNAGPTLFPVGTVATDVANGSAWVDLATGSIDTSAAAQDIVLTLDTGFANTLAANTGPVFPVNAATVSIVGDLTITIGGGGTDLDFTGVASTGNHNANGSFGGGDLDIAIDASSASKPGYIEPRQFGAAGNLYVRVDFAEAITGGSVVSNPALGGLTATPNGNSLDITFAAPANGTCYSFDVTGTTSASNSVGVGSSDTDFCICYQEGDINFDSFVNASDRSVVTQPANLFNTMDAIGITGPQVDLNRDGIMNASDRSIVTQPANLFNDFTAVTCP
ncbi:MAG TPA: dockerin type I domain-containing protein [Phycisphaerae bacterium]|nr:dockerin type I domain-containing protein [Phycisphaerae bacterium]